MNDEWALIAHQKKDLPSGGKEAKASRASSVESDDIKLADKSFSEPNSPVLSRKTSLITLKERTHLCSHSSYNDLTSPLIGEDEERIGSPTRTHLTSEDPLHQESPDASNTDQKEQASSRERSPVTEEAGVASGSDHEQEQQQGSIFSRFTGRLLQKVLTSSPENRPEDAQGDTSSVRTMFQAFRTGVASLTSSTVSSSAPTAPTTTNGDFTASEEEQIFEQMKKSSKTKFIKI